MILLALTSLVYAEPLTPEAWLRDVQATRAALAEEQPGAVDQLRELSRAEVLVTSDTSIVIGDPMLPMLAEAIEIGVPEARGDGLRHLAVVERHAAALVRAPPLPVTTAPLVAAEVGGGEGVRSEGRLFGMREALRGWAASVAGGTGEAGAALLIGGVITCGLVMAVLLSLRGVVRPAVPAPPPMTPRLPAPAPNPKEPAEAIRAAFLELLLLVEARGWVPQVALTTNGRVAEALDGLAWERFRVAREIYERTWYGGDAATEGDLLRVREALEALT